MSSHGGEQRQNEPVDSPLRRFTPYLVFGWIIVFWARFFLTELQGVEPAGLDRVDFLYLVPQLLWNFLFPDPTGERGMSWANLAQRIPILLYASFIVSSCMATGTHLIRILDPSRLLSHSARTALAGGMGYSSISLLTLALGCAGLQHRWLFSCLLLLPIVTLLIVPLRNGIDIKHLQASWQHIAKHHIWLMGCLVMLFPMLLGAMLPSTDFDVKEYHLEGPKEYFLAGHIHFLPHNVYTSFPFLTEMLSLCSMVLADDWFFGSLVGKTVLMTFAPITAMGVYVVGKHVADSKVGMVAALIYLSTPWVYRISIIAYTEGAMCCYVVLTLLALLTWREVVAQEQSSNSISRLTLLVGLLAGSAIATKYPGMVMVAIPTALVLLCDVVRHRLPVQRIMKLASLFILGGVLTFGPWVAKNFVETGNPVYPLMYSVFGGEDWDEELNEKWKAGHARPSPLFKSPPEMLSELKKSSFDVSMGSIWQSALMFGLAPLSLFLMRRHRGTVTVLGAAFALLLVWYTLTHMIDRFWVPVLPVIAVLAGLGWQALFKNLLPLNHQTPLALVLIRRGLIVVMVVTFVFNFAFMVSPASGDNSYLIELDLARKVVKPESVQLAAYLVEPGDRVLFVGEAMVFDAEFDYRYNTVFDKSLLEEWTSRKVDQNSWQLLSGEEIRKKFENEGITQIVINWNEILRYRTTYGYTDFVSPERIKQLAQLWPFEEVQLPDNYNLKDWEKLSPAEQQEIETWGPELKRVNSQGEPMIKQYQLFQLTDSLNGHTP